ncbi:MAG: AMP-binding protein, partial [Brevibacterium sp.]
MRAISQASPAKDFTPTPRRGVNVSRFLTQTARRIPDHTAVIDDDHGQRWTWKDLDDRADALACTLQASGVGRRDTVLLVSANHAEVIQSFWGIIRAGAVIAPPNAALSTEELLNISADVAPAAIIVDRAHEEFVEALQRNGFAGSVLWIGELPETAAEEGATGETRTGDFAVEEDDPCWYFFTSGSTGKPKA